MYLPWTLVLVYSIYLCLCCFFVLFAFVLFLGSWVCVCWLCCVWMYVWWFSFSVACDVCVLVVAVNLCVCLWMRRVVLCYWLIKSCFVLLFVFAFDWLCHRMYLLFVLILLLVFLLLWFRTIVGFGWLLVDLRLLFMLATVYCGERLDDCCCFSFAWWLLLITLFVLDNNVVVTFMFEYVLRVLVMSV